MDLDLALDLLIAILFAIVARQSWVRKSSMRFVILFACGVLWGMIFSFHIIKPYKQKQVVETEQKIIK